jgi:cell division septum initiation protein DivIVA
MTKNQELAAWQAFAAAMPAASTYSGKWIAEQIHFIAADIRSDMPPGYAAASMTDARDALAAARTEAAAIAARAKAEAEHTLTRARNEAEEIKSKAREAAARTLSGPLYALRQAVRALEA